jgi:hypothetical protein
MGRQWQAVVKFEVARHQHASGSLSTAVTVRNHPRLYVGRIRLFCDYLLGYSVHAWGRVQRMYSPG